MTPGDRAIIDRAIETGNLNYISNYYLRSEDSGTWWRPVDESVIKKFHVPEFADAARRLQSGYDTLLATWKSIGQPDYFLQNDDGRYIEVDKKLHDESIHARRYRTIRERGTSLPTFHHNHGFMFLQWFSDMQKQPQKLKVVVGGLGSGKTLQQASKILCWAIMYKSFRAFAFAPYSVQANEVYKIILQITRGTLYEQRFIRGTPKKPVFQIEIGHSDVGGDNTIECYPILDDPDKIRTLTGDCAMVDQAEKFPDIDAVMRDIGSRFRGQVSGRERIGELVFLANSGESPTLWDLYDEHDVDPENIYSCSPHTSQNPYLTINDMLRYQKMVGKTIDEYRMYLGGGRPLGSGEWFPESSLRACKADWLDDMMEENLVRQDKLMTAGKQVINPWIRRTGERVKVFRWEMPPKLDSTYIVAADPGWKNPPGRDSAGISVWEINGFPFMPARLAAFHWVYGEGSPDPWINQYVEYVLRYRAIGMNGYDATGSGSGYIKINDIAELLPYPIQLGTTKKLAYLTLLQKMMASGKFQIPSIDHIFSQLAKYEYPEKPKARQDLVMMLLVAAAVLEPFWYNKEQQVYLEDDEDEFDISQITRVGRDAPTVR